MIRGIIAKLEEAPVTFAGAIAAFCGIVVVRFFLENLSNPPSSFPAVPDAAMLIHYALFYAVAYLMLALIVGGFIKNLGAASKTLLAFFPVIWSPPVIDLIVSHGRGYPMAYLFGGGYALIHSFVSFGGPAPLGGVTPGIRAELIAMVIGIFAYVAVRTRNAGKALLAALCSYAAIFFLLALPVSISAVFGLPISAFGPTTQSYLADFFASSHAIASFVRPSLQPSYQYIIETSFDLGMAYVLYLMAIALLAVWWFIYDRRTATAVIRNWRPVRAAHYLSLVVLGAYAAARIFHVDPFADGADWLAFIMILLSFFLAWMAAVGWNDIEDVAIDRVNDPGRPLVRGMLSPRAMKEFSRSFGALALIGAFLAGYWPFFCLLLFTAAYYVYSVSPLRLKRIPVIAPFLVSLACLAAAMAGFFFVSPDHSVYAFPRQFLLIIVVFFALFSNVKDMKDIRGDREGGIMTIPALFGRAGASVTGALVVMAFLAVPAITGDASIFILSLLAAAAGYFFTVIEPYREWRVFAVYALYVASLVIVVR